MVVANTCCMKLLQALGSGMKTPSPSLNYRGLTTSVTFALKLHVEIFSVLFNPFTPYGGVFSRSELFTTFPQKAYFDIFWLEALPPILLLKTRSKSADREF